MKMPLWKQQLSLRLLLIELDYEILEKGSSGFLGIGSKPAKIKARKLMETVDRVEEFLADVFAAMQI